MKDMNMTKRTLDEVLIEAQTELLRGKGAIKAHATLLDEASGVVNTAKDAKLIGKFKRRIARLIADLEDYHADALDGATELNEALADNMVARR